MLSGAVLFPKLAAEGIAIDISSSEDEEARGELGAPFTEPEHEEEWMDWVSRLDIRYIVT